MKTTIRRYACIAAMIVALGAVGMPSPTSASSEAEWVDLRMRVEAGCRQAVGGILDSPSVVVDPFGSERFGLAVLTGRETGGEAVRSVVCVYDKVARNVEVGGPIDLSGATSGDHPERTSETPFAGQCAEECEGTLSVLAEPDRLGPIDLSSRIRNTIEAIEMPADGADARTAWEVAAAAAAPPGMAGAIDLSAPVGLASGEGECTLRWFGFLEETERKVGVHRCRIERAGDGAIWIEKTSGERMRAQLLPLNDKLSAYVGRSFLPDQTERDYDPAEPLNATNANFGNVVGLAVLVDGQLHLLGGAQLGMQPPDDTFFSVLTLSGG